MENLKKLRNSKGLSQAAFAKEIHVSQNAISQWEKGIRQPSNETLKYIAEYFNVSVDYLLGRDGDLPIVDKELQGLDFALYGEVKDLTEAEKNDILSYIRFRKAQRGE